MLMDQADTLHVGRSQVSLQDRQAPGVQCPPFAKFFSEAPWSIRTKFYMMHLLEGGTNVFINNPGYMTKMVQALQKSSSELVDQFK